MKKTKLHTEEKIFGLLLMMMLLFVQNYTYGQDIALDFDPGDYVDMPDINELDDTQTFTIETWVYFDQLTDYAYIFGKESSGTNRIVIQLSTSAYGGNDELAIAVGALGLNGYAHTTDDVFKPGTWYHIAVVFEGMQTSNDTRLKLYINGVQQILTFPLANIPNTTSNSTATCRLGADGGGPIFDGKLDELRIWSDVRGSDEILTNMEATLTGTEEGLVALYNFNQGNSCADNTGQSSLIDNTASSYSGTLHTFSLTGGSSNYVNGEKKAMQLVFDTSLGAGGTIITLPLYGTVDATVDWGDGTIETFTAEGNQSHTYGSDGVYTVNISGSLSQFGDGNTGYANVTHLGECLSFGDIGLTSLSGAFHSAVNLTHVPDTLPTTVTDLSYMLNSATSLDQDLSTWDVRNITDMTGMLTNVSLSPEYYSNMLTAWSALPVGSVITLDAPLCKYYISAQSARDALTGSYGWTINDAGLKKADAGLDTTVCGGTVRLEAIDPWPDTGLWTRILGGGTIINPTLYNTWVNGLNPGTNVFRWTVGADHDEVIITDDTPSMANISGGDRAICVDWVDVIANQPTIGSGIWSSSVTGVTFSSPTNYTTTALNLQQGSNILRWTISNGMCETSEEVIITNNSVTVNAGPNQEICSPEATLQADMPPDGATGSWRIIQGNCAFADNTLYNTTITGIQEGENIFEWMLTRDGCVGIDSVHITNNEVLLQTFSAATNEDTTAFSVDIQGDIDYIWNFGDGQSSAKMTPTHRYRTDGVYEACLILQKGICETSDCQIITIGSGFDNCRADFGFEEIEPLIINVFNYSMGEDIDFQWDFGDGDSLKFDYQMNHVYAQPGFYDVTLTISNADGCNHSLTKTVVVGDTTLAAPKADFAYNNEGNPQEVTFNNLSKGKVHSYVWDFGDKQSSNIAAPSHSYANPGIYTACLTVMDTINNFQSEVCKEVIALTEADPVCKARFDYIFSSDQTQLTLFDQSMGDIDQWYWEFDNGLTFSDSVAKVSDLPAGTYNVCLTVRDNTNDLQSTSCKTVTVGYPVQAAFTSMVFHDENRVILKARDQANISNPEYIWMLGDGRYLNGQRIEVSYDQPGDYVVCLQVLDTDAKTFDKLCKTITVGMADCPTEAHFSVMVDQDSKSITLTDESIGQVDKRFWQVGDGQTFTTEKLSYTYTADGEYLVSLAVQNATDVCADYAEKMVRIGTLPCEAAFDYQVDMLTGEVNFINQSRGDVSGYRWELDNGEELYDENPIYSYVHNGLYDITLTVSNADGSCIDDVSHSVQVGGVDCSADFTAFVDADFTTSFIPKTLGKNLKYSWEFGNGSVSTNMKPEYAYTNEGYYTVSLSVYNTDNHCIDTKTKKLLIGAEGNDLQAEFAVFKNKSSNTVHFLNRSNGQIANYLWNFGDGSTDKTKQPAAHPYETAGYYTVCLTVYGSDDKIQHTACQDIAVGFVEQNIKAAYAHAVDATSKTAFFMDCSQGPVNQRNWSFGDQNNSQEVNPMHQYKANDYYLVWLKAENTSLDKQSYFIDMVNVGMGNDGFRCGFGSVLLPPDASKLSGYPVDFIGTSFGNPAKYVWSFGDGNQDSTTLNPTHYYDEPGEYEVCLTVSDPNTGEDNTYCETVVVEGTAISEIDNQLFNWSVYPNPVEREAMITYELAKTAQVRLTAFDMLGNQVDILKDQQQTAGQYQVNWSVNHLKSGFYILEYQVNETVHRQKVMVGR